MADILTMTGEWQGEFSYGPEYGEDFVDKKVDFVLQLIDINEQFEGKCIDEQGVGASPHAATIRGFTHEGFISFIKQYPISHYIDETGQTHFDYERTPPELHYTGSYNTDTKSFSGEWEMTIEEQISDGRIMEYLFTGQWMMKKK